MDLISFITMFFVVILFTIVGCFVAYILTKCITFAILKARQQFKEDEDGKKK